MIIGELNLDVLRTEATLITWAPVKRGYTLLMDNLKESLIFLPLSQHNSTKRMMSIVKTGTAEQT